MFEKGEKKIKNILHLAYLKVFLNAIAHHPSKAWFSVKEKQSLIVTTCNFLEAPTQRFSGSCVILPEILIVWQENLISRAVLQQIIVLQFDLANNIVYEGKNSKWIWIGLSNNFLFRFQKGRCKNINLVISTLEWQYPIAKAQNIHRILLGKNNYY